MHYEWIKVLWVMQYIEVEIVLYNYNIYLNWHN